ncbi:MAG: hypothetical protein ACFCUM_17945 [Bacteroidales bacterium]
MGSIDVSMSSSTNITAKDRAMITMGVEFPILMELDRFPKVDVLFE